MSISNPNKLVEEFKKSGEFDRIRRELLTQFQNSEGLTAFKSRIEDVARQRLTNDHNLMYMPQEFIYRELMQELDRFPIVERSTSELPMLNDPAFAARISGPLEKLLQDQGITFNKANHTEQESPQSLPQGTNSNPQAIPNDGNKETRSDPSDNRQTDSKSSDGLGATLDASGLPANELASTLPPPSEKMEVDED